MLRDEIKRYMSGVRTSADGQIHAQFSFPREFTGFNGHFPDLPILPGVCTLQAALAMVETERHTRLRMEEITQAKFSAIVFPDQVLDYVCTESNAENGLVTLRASASRDGDKVADIVMKVAYLSSPSNWRDAQSGPGTAE